MIPEEDVIAAAATAPGLSALAVVRLSGEGSAALVEGLAGLPAGRLKGMRRARISIPDCGGIVALGWPRGKSYTGEEMVELICHGIPETVSSLCRAVTEAGARPAFPGEFTARAFRNGKLSGHDVISLAAAVETGKVTEPLGTALDRLQEAVSAGLEILEGQIEFQEEAGIDTDNDPAETVRNALDLAEKALGTIRGTQRALKVYITGPVNAGKSTLFNTLCEEPVALVNPMPGTTRDGARREISLGSRRFILIDTPGFGGDGIDREALDAALRGISSEDRVLWLCPEGKDPPDSLADRVGGRVTVVVSKADLHGNRGFRVSGLTGEGVDELRDLMKAMPAIPGEENALEIRELLLRALPLIGSDMGAAAALVREAEAAVQTLTGYRPDLPAVERALRVLCVGK